MDFDLMMLNKSKMEIPFLTSGESKVYQALIELGESSVGNILKSSGVSHSKIYDILKRLAEKGLVSSINKNGRQYFYAAEPGQLSNLMAEKEAELQTQKESVEEIIKKLNVRKNISKPTSILSSYEGFRGMKTVLEAVLKQVKPAEEILILGSPKKIGEQAGGYLKEWQRKRIQTGAKCKIITDLDSPSWEEEWWEKSKKKRLTFTKRAPSASPAYFVITSKSVVTIYFSEVILSLMVEHKEIAKKYKNFFYEVWGKS